MQICEALFKGVNSQLYPYQTKIWEGETNDENGSWPKLTTHALETGFTNPQIFVWETTVARNTHAGFCKDFYDRILY